MVTSNSHENSDSQNAMEAAKEVCRIKVLICRTSAEKSMACPCEICQVNASLQTVLAVAYTSAFFAFGGKPECLNRLIEMAGQLTDEFPEG